MKDCFHNWVQVGRMSDDEYQCLKCLQRVAYRKVNRHTAESPVRKPLTDEEVDKIIAEHVTITDQHLLAAVYMAIRDVEQAHGIHE